MGLCTLHNCVVSHAYWTFFSNNLIPCSSHCSLFSGCIQDHVDQIKKIEID